MIHDRGPKDRAETPVVSIIPILMGNGTRALRQARSILFSRVGTFADRWPRRRQEEIPEARQVLKRLPSCRDRTEVWQIQRAWVQGAIQRLAVDALDPPGSAVMWASASSLASTRVVPRSENDASVETQDMRLSSPAVRTVGR